MPRADDLLRRLAGALSRSKNAVTSWRASFIASFFGVAGAVGERFIGSFRLQLGVKRGAIFRCRDKPMVGEPLGGGLEGLRAESGASRIASVT
jgi:hypothetical protein